MARRVWRQATAALVLLGLYGGCTPFAQGEQPTQGPQSGPDAAQAQSEPEEAVAGLSLLVALEESPTTLDPAYADSCAEYTLVNHLFQGLYAWRGTENGTELVPAAATGYELSVAAEGAATYTFYLDQNAMWADGIGLTAGDFEYAWKRLAERLPGAPTCGLLAGVQNAEEIRRGELPPGALGVAAYSDEALTVTLVAEDEAFLARTSQPGLFPLRQDAVERAGEEGDWSLDDVLFCGNGPYRLAGRENGQLVLRSTEETPQGPSQITFSLGQGGTESTGEDGPHLSVGANGQTGAESGWRYMLYVERAEGAGEEETEALGAALALALDCASLAASGDRVAADEEVMPQDVENALEQLALAGYPQGEDWPEGAILLLPEDRLGEALGEKITAAWRQSLGVEVEARKQAPEDPEAHPLVIHLLRAHSSALPEGAKPLLAEQYAYTLHPSLTGVVCTEDTGFYLGGCGMADG